MTQECEIILQNSSILLVEDEQSVRESFAKVLLLYVGKVYTAEDGETAYEIFKKQSPDIIITDVKMPKINGLDLIKMIRKENMRIPVIVTSAYTDQDFLLESIKLSLVEYVVKPMKESDLIRLLEICAHILHDNRKTKVSINSRSSYDYDNKILIKNGVSFTLTHKEIDFFELLLAHKGDLVTKQSIEDKLYIYEEAPPTALKNLVFKLRKKIGNDIVKTVGKLGYMIEK